MTSPHDPQPRPGYPGQQPGYPPPPGPWQPGGYPGPAQPPGYPPPQNPWPGQPASGPQPVQQFGAGATYGGFGAFEAAPKPKRSKKPWLIGGAVLVVLAGAGVAAWLLGAFRGEVLDQKSVEDGVQKILREDFGEGDVKNVSCPKDRPVATGTIFDCTVTVAGQPKKVTVRVLNDQAQYEVGAPK
ncbi:DUF4333 domain-containing protein [Amycolatopsis sp. GM8]|uniref:DUF4333 domain-containing protein n=1 Tax=Amycolatopsis sp. GM8 TaxID=2896530 RepID=UPI001F44A96D|nr:DUF4333 domain-containing protein [Amycolatopsis sp. GM8]